MGSFGDCKCPVCGKKFLPAPLHAYKINDRRLVCSWSCVCEYRRRKEARGDYAGPRSARRDVPILQLDKAGKLVRRWESINEAAGELNLSPYLIAKCCAGYSLSHKGFKWKFEKDVKENGE